MLMLAGMLLRAWRQVPYVGFVVAPIVSGSCRHMLTVLPYITGFVVTVRLQMCCTGPVVQPQQSNGLYVTVTSTITHARW
jgi:hypothetical protein